MSDRPNLRAENGGAAGDPVFADGKAPDALRTIGEVAVALGIRQHVLRYWEEQFPVLSPLKRSGGRRYYRPEDVRLLSRINDLLHHQGYTIRGARAALAASGSALVVPSAVSAPTPQPAPEPAMAAPTNAATHSFDLAQLRAVRDSLAAALSAG